MPITDKNQILLICLKVLADLPTPPTPSPHHTARRTLRLDTQLRLIGIDDTSAARAWTEIVQSGWASGDSSVPGTLYVTPQGQHRIKQCADRLIDAPTGSWLEHALYHLYQ